MTLRLQSFFLFGSLLLLTACGSEKLDPNQGVTVTIPVSKNGTYQYQAVKLTTLEKLDPIMGLASKFLVKPTLSSEGLLSGASPRTQYRMGSGGDVIASQVSTLQYFTIYYHFERLQAFDRDLGLESLNKWPRTTLVDVPSEGTQAGGVEQNAMYVPSLDAYVFFRNESKSWPLAMNAGVIAHEHFHSLFYKLVKSEKWSNSTPSGLNPHRSKTFTSIDSEARKDLSEKDLYSIYLLRGLNEGFADFWGYLYSSDSDFVGRSIPGEKSRRIDTNKLRSFETQSEFLEKVRLAQLAGPNNSKVVGQQLIVSSYQLANQLAQALNYFVKAYLKDENTQAALGDLTKQKLILGQQVIASVKNLQKAVLISEKTSDALINPASVIYSFFKDLPAKSPSFCESINAYLAQTQKDLLFKDKSANGVLINGGSDVCK